MVPGNWDSEIGLPARWVLVRMLFQVANCYLLLVSSHGGRGQGGSFRPLLQEYDLVFEDSPL